MECDFRCELTSSGFEMKAEYHFLEFGNTKNIFLWKINSKIAANDLFGITSNGIAYQTLHVLILLSIRC